MWFLPLPLPHIQVLALSFDFRNLLRFATFHLCLYVSITLYKRKHDFSSVFPFVFRIILTLTFINTNKKLGCLGLDFQCLKTALHHLGNYYHINSNKANDSEAQRRSISRTNGERESTGPAVFQCIIVRRSRTCWSVSDWLM